MKFHHMLTVTGLFYFSFKASKQFYIVYALGLTEITNPFLQGELVSDEILFDLLTQLSLQFAGS